MIISNFLWHGFTVIVRAFAIALMLTIYPGSTSIALLVHVLVMYMFIACCWKTTYCPERISCGRTILKVFYEIIAALVLTVTWVNFSPKKQRSFCGIKLVQMTIFYFILTIENAVFLILWRVQTKGDVTTLNLPAWGIENLNIDEFLIYCCGALHAIGLIVMVLYYKCCHPVPIKDLTIDFEMLENDTLPRHVKPTNKQKVLLHELS